jgi:hypothetical protein
MAVASRCWGTGGYLSQLPIWYMTLNSLLAVDARVEELIDRDIK